MESSNRTSMQWKKFKTDCRFSSIKFITIKSEMVYNWQCTSWCLVNTR
ncbi:hypothetical protein KSF78_0005665 [Schistosoma japonicum]|nr:hypothetical protein KSF78_0005665 [Schistosoma japonicum]